MIIKQFKRLFLKWQTAIYILYLTVIGLVSYYFTNQERLMWQEQLDNPSPSLNVSSLAHTMKEYDQGITYFLKFLFSTSDFYWLYIMSVLVITGILISAELLNQKNEGIGVYCVTRSRYKTFLKGICGGMALYVAAIICSSMGILLVISHFAGGFSVGTFGIGGRDLSMVQQVIAAGIQVSLLIVFTSLAMLISAMLSMWTHNPFFARILPAALFMVIPQVLGNTLANVFHKVGPMLCDYIPVNLLSSVPQFLTIVPGPGRTQVAFDTILGMVLLAIIFAVVYMKNVSQFSKEYL